MTAKEWNDLIVDQSGVYGDKEASAASGVPLPSLRVLQAAGAIRSQKFSKPHGGFRRTWPKLEVLKAAIAAAMSEHFAWNIRIVAEAMAKIRSETWEVLVANSNAEPESTEYADINLVVASDQDWHLELVDRKFLFVRATALMSGLLSDGPLGRTAFLIGMVQNFGFQFIPWNFRSSEGGTTMENVLQPDTYQKMDKLYRVAMTAEGNFLSKSTINGSMQIRMASLRLHGRKGYFVQDLLQSRKEETES